MHYVDPASAQSQSVVSALSSSLNNPPNPTLTIVMALAHGDRIELQSTDRSKTGAQVSLSVANSIGAGATTWISASRTNIIETIAHSIRNFQVTAPTNPVPGSFLQATITKTNGTQFSFSVTNTSGDMTLIQMAPQLINLINASPDLTNLNGLSAQDLITVEVPFPPFQYVEFNLLA